MRRITRRISYANVTASLALFLALGGISWAATTLPRDSVGAKQIRIGAVGSSEVKDGALKPSDFAAGALPAGPQGPTGPTGPTGAQGATGPKGEPGTARAFAYVNSACGGPGGACEVYKAKNIVGARRPYQGIYCVQVAVGIDVKETGPAAGVHFAGTQLPEGNATAMVVDVEGPCEPSEVMVITERIPQVAPVVNGKAHVAAASADDVAFWVLVP